MIKTIFKVFSIFLLSFFMSFCASAQTVLIDPAGDGGFENGTTFAANNWIEVNGTQTNKWYVGAAATGYTGARCAYIGTAITNNTYNISSTSVVHFYRDVTFPVGQPNVSLSFRWKGVGEAGYDFLRVHLVPTTTTPATGVMLNTGQLGANLNLSSNWQTTTLGLPCNLAGTTMRLVFTWRNDFSVGTNPPGCIDNISLVASASTSCLPFLGTGVTNVASLPYNSGPGSTCGQGNDLFGANTTPCGAAWYLTGEDRVWIFTPTATGQVTIALNAPSASYTGLMLYQNCPITTVCGGPPAVCVAFAQNYTGSKSICANVTAGATYYLVLDSWNAPYCNNYNSLTISSVSTSTLGTICASAIAIPSLPYSVSNHTTTCMGNDYTNATAGVCNTVYSWGEDIVYSFTVTSAQCIGISITNASNNDIGYAVYQGCPGSGGTCIGSTVGATAGNLASSITLPGAGNYYLIIDTRNPSPNVTYDLQIISYGSGPVNDRPYQATPLPFNIPIAGNNSCSGNVDEPLGQPGCFQPSGGNPLNTVWYSFIAPASGCVRIRTNLGTLLNTQIAAYGPVTGSIAAGSGNTLPLIACNQDLPPCGVNTYPSSQLNLTGLTPGSTYYISVDGYGFQTGSFSIFMIDAGVGCNTQFPPAPGQDCALAFPVCRSSIVVADPGPQAVGNVCEFSNNVNCLLSGERGSYWYRINIVANGFLEFSIVPNDWPGAPSTAATDYDFAVWRTKTAGVPGPANCNNLSSVAPISCNYSFLGVTGCYSANNGVAPPAYPGFGPAFQSRITVTAGDEYLLIVSNFTNSTSGFTLSFPVTAPIATVPPAGGTLVWTGTLNTDWYNPENWGGCAAPSCVYNVSISPVPVNQPSVTGLTAVCGSLDIPLGASVTLQPGGMLKVCGNFVNNGTFNAFANSTLLMQSDSVLQNQFMTGSMTGANRLWNLTINKPATLGGNTVTLNNDVDNGGNFLVGANATYQGGIFNTNGNYHRVAGNFTVHYTSIPNAIYNAAGSTLEFYGAASQLYYNTGMLNNVLLNHTGPGVTLGNSGAIDFMTIGGNLNFLQGKIITGANRVNVVNTVATSVSAGNATSYVEGNLKRAYSPAGGSYDFPVGTAAKGYQRINFDFGASNDRINSIVSFSDAPPATPVPFLGPECISSVFDQTPLNHGLWNTVTTPAIGVSPYSATAYNNNFTNQMTGYTVMIKNNTSPWGFEGTCVPASTINAIQRMGMTSLSTLSQFAIAQSLSPLPVELLFLKATSHQKFIRLSWATASETNNSGFEIQRATDPSSFEKIGWSPGLGNSFGINSYEFDDYNVEINQLYYYRLNQIDFDGMGTLTDVVAGKIISEGYTINALPNPYVGTSNITLLLSHDADVHLEVISSLGQIVATPVKSRLSAGSYVCEFGSDKVGGAKGVYTVRVRVDGEVSHIRLIEMN